MRPWAAALVTTMRLWDFECVNDAKPRCRAIPGVQPQSHAQNFQPFQTFPWPFPILPWPWSLYPVKITWSFPDFSYNSSFRPTSIKIPWLFPDFWSLLGDSTKQSYLNRCWLIFKGILWHSSELEQRPKMWSRYQYMKWVWKCTHLKLKRHLSGANHLIFHTHTYLLQDVTHW